MAATERPIAQGGRNLLKEFVPDDVREAGPRTDVALDQAAVPRSADEPTAYGPQQPGQDVTVEQPTGRVHQVGRWIQRIVAETVGDAEEGERCDGPRVESPGPGWRQSSREYLGGSCIVMFPRDVMMRAVRTTVNIDDRLLRQAKLEAARSNRSLGDVMDDALRLLLAPTGRRRAERQFDLPVFGGSGLRPGVDLEDKEGLAALLDDETSTHASG